MVNRITLAMCFGKSYGNDLFLENTFGRCCLGSIYLQNDLFVFVWKLMSLWYYILKVLYSFISTSKIISTVVVILYDDENHFSENNTCCIRTYWDILYLTCFIHLFQVCEPRSYWRLLVIWYLMLDKLEQLYSFYLRYILSWRNFIPLSWRDGLLHFIL
jgi:hypothetical protein